MRASCLLIVASLAGAHAAWASPEEDGDGLTVTLPKMQGRVRLGMSTPAPEVTSFPVTAGDARLSGASLLGDYYFGTRSATRDGDSSGFRATSGVYVGSRTGLWGGQTSASPGSGLLSVDRQGFSLAAPTAVGETGGDAGSTAVPYLGLGYSGHSIKSGWGFSADFGLMALNPGGALRLGRAFGGGQSLEELMRELRFSPVVQLGVSYSF